MVQTIKNKIKNIRSIRISKLNIVIISVLLVINAIILGLNYFLPTYRFNVEFIRENVVQLLVIVLGGGIAFYLTFDQLTRKKPTLPMVLGYLFAIGVTLLSLSGSTFLVERLSGRATFSLATTLVLMFTFLFFTLMLGRYDFPLVESKEKLFVSIEEHFMKNVGVYLVLFFIIAWVGLLNGIFSPLFSAVLFLVNLYGFKVLLSNFRK